MAKKATGNTGSGKWKFINENGLNKRKTKAQSRAPKYSAPTDTPF